MFDAVRRDEVESVLIGVAEKDDRISAAAVVGSRAHTPGDRWSDVDLTFAVTSENLIEVLDAFGETLSTRDGVELFDLLAGPITNLLFAESDQAPELAARVERDPQSGDVRPCEKV
jgi:hypothetical protein